VVAHHVHARTGRRDDGFGILEYLDEPPGGDTRLAPVARVEAGWPQQVWFVGQSSSSPSRRRTLTMASPTSGTTASTRHWMKRVTVCLGMRFPIEN